MRLTLIPILLAVTLVGDTVSRPPIAEAARNGDRDTIRALIQNKADVNAAEGDGATALHWAAYRDDLQSADLLIRAGAKVNAPNDLGATPLWVACQNGSIAMVKNLLAAGANPNVALLSGETPLIVAARVGNTSIVAELVAKDANVNARAGRGQTALMWAAAQKHPDVVKALLEARPDIHARSQVWSQVVAVPPHGYGPNNKTIQQGGDTALMFAVRSGDLESAKLLVAAGANVNDSDAWGVSATALAAHSDSQEIVEFLLEKGADASASAVGFSPLHIAIMHRDEKMASTLLAHGADPNAPLRTWTPTRRSSDDYNFPPALVGATPIWLAARFNQPGVIRLLVKHHADPLFVHHSQYVAGEGFQMRKESTTILMAALGMGGGGGGWAPLSRSESEPLILESVKLVAELGVDVNAANLDGRTALTFAKRQGYNSVVEFLTEKGAK